MNFAVSMGQYSMANSAAQLQYQVSLSVTKKAMDSAEVQAQNLINGMLQGIPSGTEGNLVDVLA